ncbi:DUF3786 domain-containing protein [Chloroflexota bacterium]
MLIGEGQDWLDGVEQAWVILSSLSSEDVCRQAKVGFDELAGHYILSLFNEKIYISPEERRVWGDSELADLVLNELSHYSILAALWYLIQAKDIPFSGNLVSPREVNGGLIFALGSHVLPLNGLVEKYGSDVESLVKRGVALGGEQLNYGDASVRLFPFPRVPLVLLIWKRDEEFHARADILFDSTCSEHLPTDIIWSTAMMSILVML